MFIFTFICLLLLTVYGILIDYYRRAWKAIPSYRPAPESPPPVRTKISVLVPARNEEKNIGACLDSLFRQTYPKQFYQVIVIDDHSTDRTWGILKSLFYPDMSLTALQLADHEPAGETVKAYKKFAIDTGIRYATGDLIVTTDADCQFHPDWLRTLAGFYEATGAKFVAAPVRIGSGRTDRISPVKQRQAGEAVPQGPHAPQSFLSIFQTLDFITLQGITGAAVYKRFHSMCNGANLAYEKKAFYEVGGFKDIDSIPSGDDMLLMHKIYLKYPEQVFFLKNQQAIVSTAPETSWDSFFNQRIRWASKADRYDDKRIFWVLLLVYIVNLLFVGWLLASCWNSACLWILLILLAVKTMLEYPFVRLVAAFFEQQKLLVYFPAMAPFHILYTVGIGWLGKFGSYRWKERKINK